MAQTVIHIKNMVCPRCISAVKDTLSQLNIPYSEVKLGEAIIETKEIDFDLLDIELKKIGFELIQDKNQKIAEQIKALIIDLIHHSDDTDLKTNLSDFLSTKLNKNYTLLSKVFSEYEGLSIEKYYILQKIEKVKELITYGELTFSEIAYRLNYSSLSHLSKQFKSVTDKTLSAYKKDYSSHRKTLDQL